MISGLDTILKIHNKYICLLLEHIELLKSELKQKEEIIKLLEKNLDLEEKLRALEKNKVFIRNLN